MLAPESKTWLVVASHPVIGVAATLLAYSIALRINRRFRGHPITNPTLVAILMLALTIKLSGLAYADYARSAAVVSFMLSPAVVLLAVPLYRKRALIRRSGLLVAVGLCVGLPTGIISGVGFAWALGASRPTLLSLAPKSATAGIAIGISEKIGGLPALTAVLVIMTGIVGAIVGPGLAAKLRVHDPRAVGLAIGITSHGIGTARALQLSETVGAFAGLGMGLNGVLTAVVVPLACRFF